MEAQAPLRQWTPRLYKRRMLIRHVRGRPETRSARASYSSFGRVMQ